MKQAFNYLNRFSGIDFIDKHYGYVHTQSFESMVEDIAGLCRRKGGQIIMKLFHGTNMTSIT